MLDEQITLKATDARRARRAVRSRLTADGIAADHVDVVETVVGELLAAGSESELQGPVRLMLETFPLLTSIRLRCPRDLEVRDDPFGLRDRVLERLTLAFGARENADGTTDLFAEIPRTSPRSA
jgi:hypothetical protein